MLQGNEFIAHSWFSANGNVVTLRKKVCSRQVKNHVPPRNYDNLLGGVATLFCWKNSSYSKSPLAECIMTALLCSEALFQQESDWFHWCHLAYACCICTMTASSKSQWSTEVERNGKWVEAEYHSSVYPRNAERRIMISNISAFQLIHHTN